jgi:hypothetical protein
LGSSRGKKPIKLSMDHLEKILKKYDFPKYAQNPIITIEELEDRLMFKLPDDYRYFLNNYAENEHFIGPEYLRLWDINNLLENNEGYHIQEYLGNNILGIGSNCSSECIMIELLPDGNYRVVLTPFLFEKEYHITIGTSFTDMLVRLDSGEEWFK